MLKRFLRGGISISTDWVSATAVSNDAVTSINQGVVQDVY